MQVFERIGRLMRADAHGMMDVLEERSLLLKQHLREAEFALAEKRAQLESLEESLAQVKEEGQALEERVAERDADVALALANEDAELARFAIRRLLPEREALRGLLTQAARLAERRDELRVVYERQEKQLVELRPKIRAELANPVRTAPPAGDSISPGFVSDEEVELELLRRRDDSNSNRSSGEASPCGG